MVDATSSQPVAQTTLFKDFSFQSIGKVPSLFKRLSSPNPNAPFNPDEDEEEQEMDVSPTASLDRTRPSLTEILAKDLVDNDKPMSSGDSKKTMFQEQPLGPSNKSPLVTSKPLFPVSSSSTSIVPSTSKSANLSIPTHQTAPQMSDLPVSSSALPSSSSIPAIPTRISSSTISTSSPAKSSPLAPVHAPPAAALRAVQQNLSASLTRLNPSQIKSPISDLEQSLTHARQATADLLTLAQASRTDAENALQLARRSFNTANACVVKAQDMDDKLGEVVGMLEGVVKLVGDHEEEFKIASREAVKFDKWTGSHENAVEMTKRRKREAELRQLQQNTKEGVETPRASLRTLSDPGYATPLAKLANHISSQATNAVADEAEAAALAWSRQQMEYLERKRIAEQELKKKKQEEEDAEMKMREEEDRLQREREKAEEDARKRREEYERKKADRVKAEQEEKVRQEKEKVELERKQKELEEMQAKAKEQALAKAIREKAEEQERSRKVAVRLAYEKKRREEEEKRIAEAEEAERQKRLQEEQDEKRRQILANKQRATEEAAEKIRKQRQMLSDAAKAQDTSSKPALTVQTTALVTKPTSTPVSTPTVTSAGKKLRARLSSDADHHTPPTKKLKPSPPPKGSPTTITQTRKKSATPPRPTNPNDGNSLTSAPPIVPTSHVHPPSTHVLGPNISIPPLTTNFRLPAFESAPNSASSTGFGSEHQAFDSNSNNGMTPPTPVSHASHLGNVDLIPSRELSNRPISPVVQRHNLHNLNGGAVNVNGNGGGDTVSRTNHAVTLQHFKQLSDEMNAWKMTPPMMVTSSSNSSVGTGRFMSMTSEPTPVTVKVEHVDTLKTRPACVATGANAQCGTVNSRNGRVSPATGVSSVATVPLASPAPTAGPKQRNAQKKKGSKSPTGTKAGGKINTRANNKSPATGTNTNPNPNQTAHKLSPPTPLTHPLPPIPPSPFIPASKATQSGLVSTNGLRPARKAVNPSASGAPHAMREGESVSPSSSLNTRLGGAPPSRQGAFAVNDIATGTGNANGNITANANATTTANSSLNDILDCDVQSDVGTWTRNGNVDGSTRSSVPGGESSFDRIPNHNPASTMHVRNRYPNVDHYSPSPPPLSTNRALSGSSYVPGGMASSYVPSPNSMTLSPSNDSIKAKHRRGGQNRTRPAVPPRRGDHYSPPSYQARSRSRSRSRSPQLRYPVSVPSNSNQRSISPEPRHASMDSRQYQRPQSRSRSRSPVQQIFEDGPWNRARDINRSCSPRLGDKRRVGYQYDDDDEYPSERGRRGRYDAPPPPPLLNGDSYRPQQRARYPPSRSRSPVRGGPVPSAGGPTSAGTVPLAQRFAIPPSQSITPAPSSSTRSDANDGFMSSNSNNNLTPSGSASSSMAMDDDGRSPTYTGHASALDLLNRITDPSAKRAPTGPAGYTNGNGHHGKHWQGQNHQQQQHQQNQQRPNNHKPKPFPFSQGTRRQPASTSGVALEQRISKPKLADRVS